MPLVAIPSSMLCPVNAYKNISVRITSTELDPAFLVPSKQGKNKPLIYRQLQGKVKALIAKTDRDLALYGTHSFRRGGCAWAFKAGVHTNLNQHYGDWLSDCFKNYFQKKLRVSESMAARITSLISE